MPSSRPARRLKQRPLAKGWQGLRRGLSGPDRRCGEPGDKGHVVVGSSDKEIVVRGVAGVLRRDVDRMADPSQENGDGGF